MTDWRALPLKTVLRWEGYAAARGVSEVARSSRGVVRALEAAGSVRALSAAWQTKRANFLARHVAQIVGSEDDRWLYPSGLPTDHALAVLMWAHWPARHRSQLAQAHTALRAWERGDVSAKKLRGGLSADLQLLIARARCRSCG